VGDPRADLLALYDRALPEVYGYLARRCGSSAVAEDLTSDTFLAAASAAMAVRPEPPAVTVAWLIGIARHKLVDHWRRVERQARAMTLLDGGAHDGPDHWDAVLDAARAHDTLARLAPQHRAVLTLRHLDDLPVAEVAELMERTVGATEVLLVRARRAFRAEYERTGGEER
jgi:RNA polymerase sigma-70 factor (ECF subfamily)